MHCGRCHYPLQNLTPSPDTGEYRCPECGLPFDPADPDTFKHRNSVRFRPAVARVTLVMFALFALVLMFYIWVVGTSPTASYDGFLSQIVCCSGGIAIFWFALLMLWTESKFKPPQVKVKKPPPPPAPPPEV